MFDQVKKLVHTSADDCKVSLAFVNDINTLREALTECATLGYKSKVKHIASRIRQVEKGMK